MGRSPPSLFPCSSLAPPTQTAFLMMLALASIFPDRAAYAAAGGAIRLLGFILYRNGYASGDPKKRMQGAVGYIGMLMMLFLSGETIYRVIVQ